MTVMIVGEWAIKIVEILYLKRKSLQQSAASGGDDLLLSSLLGGSLVFGETVLYSINGMSMPTSKEFMNRNSTDITRTRSRYERIAPFYDFMESPMEAIRFNQWRSRLREEVTGRALEVGVGTGKNISYYPSSADVTAIDISSGMLKRAAKRAALLGRRVELMDMDVQFLGFPDHSFDTIFATFVFCSVPDPVKGLRELHRVVKPEGKMLLMEHMRPSNPVLGLLFDILNPAVVRIMGANINRRTMQNIRLGGWHVFREEHLFSDIVRWVEANPK
jgi:ubiquinone/menaquinone biosynthesis C-methylase UbiE